MKRLDLTGQRFGKLTALQSFGVSKGYTLWRCICDCGVQSLVRVGDLRGGSTRSCGCLVGSPTHRRTETKEYRTWGYIKWRCYNQSADHYDRYGGRGIKVCERWLNSFQNFYDDMGKAPGKKFSIDRINNDGDYEPNNCKWTTQTEQCRNRMVYKKSVSGVTGVTWDKEVLRWSAYIGLAHKTIRLGRFDSLEQAISAREDGEIKYWGRRRNQGRGDNR